MSDKVISLYAVDDMLAKLSGMYHIEDIRAMISRMPSAETDAARWISVTEKLPEDNKRVVAIVKGQRGGFLREFAIYSKFRGEWCVLGQHDYGESREITHWMPLPDIPVKVKASGE